MGRGKFGNPVEKLYGFGLEEQKIILPTKKSERRRLECLLNDSIQRDKPFFVVSGTCPDYSHHTSATGSEIYDFNYLGESVGINTLSLFVNGAPFFEALRETGVRKMKYIVSYADVEADDPEILVSAGIERSDFVSRVQRSAKEAEKVGSGIYGGVLQVGMMSEFLLPEDYLRAEVTMSLIKENAIDDIAISRGNLYSRWFRKLLDTNVSELDELKKRRAREDIKKYLTFGFAARRTGAVILEATAPKITRLYNFGDGYSRELGLKALPPTPAIMIEDEH